MRPTEGGHSEVSTGESVRSVITPSSLITQLTVPEERLAVGSIHAAIQEGKRPYSEDYENLLILEFNREPVCVLNGMKIREVNRLFRDLFVPLAFSWRNVEWVQANLLSKRIFKRLWML